MGNYMVHSMIELGGTITDKEGSSAMWATMVNQGTGMRLVGQSLEMHSTDTAKTPFFDTLSTASYGYGGYPIDTTFLKMSKGRWYDFDGSFRRNRSFNSSTRTPLLRFSDTRTSASCDPAVHR